MINNDKVLQNSVSTNYDFQQNISNFFVVKLVIHRIPLLIDVNLDDIHLMTKHECTEVSSVRPNAKQK